MTKEPKHRSRLRLENPRPKTFRGFRAVVYGIVRFRRKRAFIYAEILMVRHYKTPVLLKRNTNFKFTKLVRYDALRYKMVF